MKLIFKVTENLYPYCPKLVTSAFTGIINSFLPLKQNILFFMQNGMITRII